MSRRKPTKKIYLHDSSPIFYGMLIAFFLLLFMGANRVITGVNLHQRMEMYAQKVRANTLKLNKAQRIVDDMIEWADKSDENLYKFYRAVNRSNDLGKLMR